MRIVVVGDNIRLALTFHPTALKAEAPCERVGLEVCGTSCVRFVQQEVFTPSLVSLLRRILHTTNSNLRGDEHALEVLVE
jgi:hypothetical protein